MRTGGFVVMVTIVTFTLKKKGQAQGNHFAGWGAGKERNHDQSNESVRGT